MKTLNNTIVSKKETKEDKQYDYASDPDRKSNPLPTEIETTYSL